MLRLTIAGFVVVSATAACSASPAAGGATAQDTCPDEIAVSEALRTTPAGWEAGQRDSTARLASVSIFDGHPREMADLVPRTMTDSGGRRVSTWPLPANEGRGYWIVCHYARSNVTLSRAIAANVSAVVVTYDLGVTIAGMPDVLKIALR